MKTGKELEADYASDFTMADGRTVSNSEMAEMMRHGEACRQARYAETGYCCDAGPTTEGNCREGPGKCLVFLEARAHLGKIEWEKQSRN